MRIEVKTGKAKPSLIAKCKKEALICLKVLHESKKRHRDRDVEVTIGADVHRVKTDHDGWIHFHLREIGDETQLVGGPIRDLADAGWYAERPAYDIPTAKPHVSEEKIELAPMLAITKFDHHFVPHLEELEVQYDIRGLAADTVTFEVWSAGAKATIHSVDLRTKQRKDGKGKLLKWNGKSDDTSTLAGKHIDPAHGPYTLRLRAQSGPSVEAKDATWVLVHSLRLEHGTYAEDEVAPSRTAKRKRWVQYKLNELGYFSGPLGDAMSPQANRALERYTHEMPNQDESSDVDAHWGALRPALQAGRHRRTLFEHATCLAKPNANVGDDCKIYVDCNYFYDGNVDEMGRENGNVSVEAAKLDRFEAPIQAKILLLSKTDADGSGAGLDCPQAVGALEVEWTLPDTSEVYTGLTANSANIPTFGIPYLQAAHTAIIAVHPAQPNDGNDNCPTANGGARAGNGSADWFVALTPFDRRVVGPAVVTKTHTDATTAAPKLGRTGMLFRASHIAGDTFQVAAKLGFGKAKRRKAIAAEHASTLADIATAHSTSTGKMTVWRRRRVSTIIEWPAAGEVPVAPVVHGNPEQAYTGGWADVRAQLAQAYVELDATNVHAHTFTSFANNPQFTTAYFDAVMAAHGTKYNRANLVLSPSGMLPIPYPERGKLQKTSAYKQLVQGYALAFFSANNFAFLAESSRAISEAVTRQRSPGFIIVHANLATPRHRFQAKTLRDKKLADLMVFGTFCGGGSRGVVFMDKTLTANKQPRFLMTHEMSHCCYLLHHEAPGSRPETHDRDDHNCVMSYPYSITSRPNLNWAVGDAQEPRFCGKCLLRLRGWKVVNANLPDRH